MKLLVGLGNVGSTYDNTRHNLGFMVLDHYVSSLGKVFKLDKSLECYILKDRDTLFIKPTTYMNLSGNSVIKVKNYYKVSDVLVISDDLDLELFKVRVKTSGSAGGHNGLKSIISVLGNDFIRLKIGISRPLDKDIVSYVLHKFSKEELKNIDLLYSVTSNIITDFINGIDIRSIQNKYN